MTFKEWFNQLSEESQNWIKRKDPWWFDEDSPDLYTHNTSKKIVCGEVMKANPLVIMKECNGRYSNRKLSLLLLSLFKRINSINKDIINDEQLQQCILYSGYFLDKNAFCFIDDIIERKRKYKENAMKVAKNDHFSHKLYLLDTIFIQEDYSNFDFSDSESLAKLMTAPELSDVPMDILTKIYPESKIMEAIKLNYNKYRINKSEINDGIFDELFFGKNGWTEKEKRSVISNNYNACKEDVLDFLKRIVAVDHTYLRYIHTLISQNTAIAKELYLLRKPKDELTGNESIQQQFRLSPEIRKLMHVSACCKRKCIGKAMRSNLGAVGPLVQMYKFDFDMIYDVLYPEDGQINWENN